MKSSWKRKESSYSWEDLKYWRYSTKRKMCHSSLLHYYRLIPQSVQYTFAIVRFFASHFKSFHFFRIDQYACEKEFNFSKAWRSVNFSSILQDILRLPFRVGEKQCAYRVLYDQAHIEEIQWILFHFCTNLLIFNRKGQSLKCLIAYFTNQSYKLNS